jgi:predicted DNA-binding transcriptional regulator AlpA
MSLQQRYKQTSSPSREKRLLTPKESMTYVGLSRNVVYEMIRDRAIPYIIRPSTGSRPRYMIDRYDWDRWIERRKIHAVA